MIAVRELDQSSLGTTRTAHNSRSSTRTATASSRPTATSARPTAAGLPRIGHPRGRLARRRPSSRASTSARTARILDRRRQRPQPVELDYPGQRRQRQQRPPPTAATAARSSTRSSPADLRDQVPVRPDPPLRRRQQEVADPLRPRPAHPRAEGRSLPHARQRPLPRDRQRQGGLDRRRLHDHRRLPVLGAAQPHGATSDSSDTTPTFPTDEVNYIRNSVKATVDAYSGKVTLYAWDRRIPSSRPGRRSSRRPSSRWPT